MANSNNIKEENDDLINNKSHDSFEKEDSDSHKHKKFKYGYKLIFKKNISDKNIDQSNDNNSSNHKNHQFKFYNKHKAEKSLDNLTEESEPMNINVINNHHNHHHHHHAIDSGSHSYCSSTSSVRQKSLKLVNGSNANSESKSEEMHGSNKIVKYSDRHSLEIKVNKHYQEEFNSTNSSGSKYSSPAITRKNSNSDSIVLDKSNTEVPFSNGNVQIDKEGFLEEIDIIRNFCGDGMSNLIAGLGGDFSFEDSI